MRKDIILEAVESFKKMLIAATNTVKNSDMKDEAKQKINDAYNIFLVTSVEDPDVVSSEMLDLIYGFSSLVGIPENNISESTTFQESTTTAAQVIDENLGKSVVDALVTIGNYFGA